MKKNQKILLGVLALVIVLAAAFWFGGNAPGLSGWVVKDEPMGPNGAELPEAQPRPEQKPDEGEDEKNQNGAQAEPGDADYSREHGMVIDPETGKDRYNTDPVPEGRPLPVEPDRAEITDETHTCTLEIRCDTILNNMDWLDPAKTKLVPEDGVILAKTQVTFYRGESVFNVLQRTCKQKKIHMEFENTPMYNSAYIEGIHNLYEFDCGEQSGWMYKVNGWFPNYGVSRYQLQEGDEVVFVYTCTLGRDVGGSAAIGG